MLVAVVVALFEGARQITLLGVTRNRVLVVAGGIIFCGVLSAVHFYASTVDSLKLELKEVGELEPDWGKNLSPEQKEEASRTRASATYTSTGTLVDYIDATGTRRKYAPTQAELKLREETVSVNQQLDTLARNGHANGIRWAFLPLFALLIGWIIGRYRRYVAANPSLQSGRDESRR